MVPREIDHLMKIFLLLLVIGMGGGLGAVFRHLLAALCHNLLGMSNYIAIMVVNILGCLLIGIFFFIIEALFNHDLESRLSPTRLAPPLKNKGWWPANDPTKPVERSFQADLSAQIWAGFLITGFLGGMTTFSLFSLLSYQLQMKGDYWGILINISGSVLLGYLATALGLWLGQKVTLIIWKSPPRL